MLLKLSQIHKTLGAKTLYEDVSFTVQPKEKVGFIGRNGMGKSTLLRIISGLDHDYSGEYEQRKDVRIIMTLQEHTGKDSVSALSYIMQDVPDFVELEQILEKYEAGESEDMDTYLDAVQQFSDKGYYFIKDLVLQSLLDFQIDAHKATQIPLAALSGGQKRFVELVRVMYSKADLLLIDEPTNHMDYVGKERFIEWMKGARESMVVVTHDRDVLRYVDTIVELKDLRMFAFSGNFDHYLRQNTTQTTNDVVAYQTKLKQLEEAAKKVEWGNRMRAKSKAWKIKYDHFVRDYERIKATIEKPSFWIDKESIADVDERVAEAYDTFKEKNVQIRIKNTQERIEQLMKVEKLSLGYTEPLFANLNFDLRMGERMFIKGRNGAGKSTLVRTLMAVYKGVEPTAMIFDGTIKLSPSLRIGEYEQEIDEQFLNGTLGDGIRAAYAEHGVDIEDQKIKQLLSLYLFDPVLDINAVIANLSGGQKARFQIIKMLANNPHLLILDEPTNHLDLPSIEELENAINKFEGAVMYISHDTYFVKNVGGKVLEIGS